MKVKDLIKRYKAIRLDIYSVTKGKSISENKYEIIYNGFVDQLVGDEEFLNYNVVSYKEELTGILSICIIR